MVRENPKAAIADILARSIYNNSRIDVTGMILFHRDYFVQVVEGTNLAIKALLGRIGKDPRHHCVQIMENTHADARSFGGFAMCAKALSPADDAIIDVLKIRDFNPLILSGDSLMKLLTTIHSVHMRVGDDVGPPIWRRPRGERVSLPEPSSPTTAVSWGASPPARPASPRLKFGSDVG